MYAKKKYRVILKEVTQHEIDVYAIELDEAIDFAYEAADESCECHTLSDDTEVVEARRV